jgi:2-polyprenyl-3-methyl-5-hydroxy-6-metoxy-1,4-benzoquinol methylase
LCWCGASQFVTFSADYLLCAACGTLVSQVGLGIEQLTVHDDSTDFYGREYWFRHQEQDLGFKNITLRARLDLPERCLHWLRTVLKYKLPHGTALELGSAHGGFVALLQWAGFQASGLELSSWVVEFARTTFNVPMLLGPVEEQQLAPGTLDVIALMDVLEHLPDPVGTMRYCLDLLRPDGVLVIQTPRYPEGRAYDAMVATNDPFLEQLKSNEHLYLFGQSSIRRLFGDLKAEHLVFEPAIFGHYDMFVVVSRQPLKINRAEVIEQVLSQTVSGRMVQTLFDADDRRVEIERELALAENDRAARLQIIESQSRQLGVLEAERNLLQAELRDLRQHFAAVEADRAARLNVIQAQGEQLGVLEAERNLLQAELRDLRQHFATAEADRAARLNVIEAQGRQLDMLARNAQTLIQKQQHLLGAIQAGRVYRALRQLGQWKWFEAGLADISSYAEHTDTQVAQLQPEDNAWKSSVSTRIGEHHWPSSAVLPDRSEVTTMQRIPELSPARYTQIAATVNPTIIHVTHWKAGSQWLHGILRQCVPNQIVPPQVDEIQFVNWPIQAGKVYPTVYVTKQQFDRVQMPANSRHFVVIRDLRDTLVSAYFSMRISHPILMSGLTQLRSTLQSLNMEDGFLYLLDEWLPCCANIQSSWIEASERVIRYEDLLEHDLDILEPLLLDECQLPVSRKRLRKVILANRFEKVTRGRERGREDITAHERKGITGDWRNHFTERVRHAFKIRYGQLLVATGYEQDFSW